VAGHDVFSQADLVRQRIGYMPENNPLHRDMRVREYLRFRGGLKQLFGKRLRERVERVMEQCSLTEVRKRIIGQLSKGYQQRVGLADALINDPELIILDEPTIGLDPHQIRSVRQMIKSLGQNHTILISTHMLPEVEMTCNRVLILHQGQIRAADSPENLQQVMSKHGQVVVELAAPPVELRDALEDLPQVTNVEVSPVEGKYSRCVLSAPVAVDLRPRIFSLACQRGWTLRELTSNRHSLEDIFVQVTGVDGDLEKEEEEF
jgi:ABC-2 type transport system ATP-binding protein